MNIIASFHHRAAELMERYRLAKKLGELDAAQKYWDESKFFLLLAAEAEAEKVAHE
jgi:hypothetical protein